MSHPSDNAEDATRNLIEGLTSSASYPHTVETLQTHISWLVFAGEHVYKIKKPVNLGFLDFSTLERRLHFCEEEVRLNRRMAPDVYLGVVPITLSPEGTPVLGGSGDVVEYAVHMQRLPASRMMDALLDRGEIDNARLRALAERLARFHGEADTGPGVDEHGSPEAVGRLMLANFDETLPWVEGPEGKKPAQRLVGRALHDHLRRYTEQELERLRGLMAARVHEGRIRDGHGDLHAGNICFVGDEVVAYDCIEFSSAFRCGDVACDLAFLAMDLDQRSFRAMAACLVDAYARLANDTSLGEVLRLYKVYRAMVRAKVGALRAAQLNDCGDAAAADDALNDARSYLQLAATYTLRPALILMCGLPASGKSYTGKHVAARYEAALIRTDVVRKQLFGFRPEQRVPKEREAEVYGPEANDRTHEAVAAKARRWLEGGRPVVCDAVFGRAATRAIFVELAQDLGVPLLLVEVRCPEACALERLAKRARNKHSVSDAGPEVYRSMRDGFETPDEIVHRIVLDGRSLASEQVEAVLTALAAFAAR